MRSRRSGSCTWGGDVNLLANPALIDPPYRARPGHRHDRHEDVDATVKARNLFRAGARVTFFGAKKVTKESFPGPDHICRRRHGRDFSMRPPCLIEKRRTSCAPPSGSPLLGRHAGPESSSGRVVSRASTMLLQDGVPSQIGLPILIPRPTASLPQETSLDTPAAVLFPDRPDDDSSAARNAETGNPEGGAQEVRRFPMRQDASSENSGCGTVGRFELDLHVFFGHFLFEKKVTRAPARKRFRAFLAPHGTRTARAPRRIRAHRTIIVPQRECAHPLLTAEQASP